MARKLKDTHCKSCKSEKLLLAVTKKRSIKVLSCPKCDRPEVKA